MVPIKYYHSTGVSAVLTTSERDLSPAQGCVFEVVFRPEDAIGIVSGRRTLRAEELARDVEGFAAHDNDLLAVEQLLCDRAGKTAEQVALAVDDLRHCQPKSSFNVVAVRWRFCCDSAMSAQRVLRL